MVGILTAATATAIATAAVVHATCSDIIVTISGHKILGQANLLIQTLNHCHMQNGGGGACDASILTDGVANQKAS